MGSLPISSCHEFLPLRGGSFSLTKAAARAKKMIKEITRSRRRDTTIQACQTEKEPQITGNDE
jgi:hypothetical protein